MARVLIDFIVFVSIIGCLTWVHYLAEDVERLNAVTFEMVRCDKDYGQNEN